MGRARERETYVVRGLRRAGQGAGRRRESEERDGGGRQRSDSSASKNVVKRQCKYLIHPAGKHHKQLEKYVKITNKNIFDNTMRNNSI